MNLSSGIHLGFLKAGKGQHLQHADKPMTHVLLLQRDSTSNRWNFVGTFVKLNSIDIMSHFRKVL